MMICFVYVVRVRVSYLLVEVIELVDYCRHWANFLPTPVSQPAKLNYHISLIII